MPNGNNNSGRPAWWQWISAIGILGALGMSGLALYDRVYNAGLQEGATSYQIQSFRGLEGVVAQLGKRVQQIESLVAENQQELEDRKTEVRKVWQMEASFTAHVDEMRRRDRRIAKKLRRIEEQIQAIAKHVKDGT